MKSNSLIFLLLIFTFFIISKNLFGQPPQYVKYVYTVIIRGQVINADDNSKNNFPNFVSGVTINVSVRYDQYLAESGNFEDKYESKTVYTDSRVYYYTCFDISAEINYMTLGMDAQFVGMSNWLLRDYKFGQDMSDTEYVKNFNVIPLIDDDENGIHDPFEFVLAQNFAPEMQPNRDPTALFPEPVEIMGGVCNSEIYVTIADDKHRLSGPWRLDLVDVYNFKTQKWEILMPEYLGKVNKRFNYSNYFQNNPIEIASITIRVWKSLGNQRGTTLQKDSTLIEPTEIDMSGGIPGNVFTYSLYLWYHFCFKKPLYENFVGNDESYWWQKYRVVKNDYPHTIYAVVWKDSEINKPVIQYWFFYPYNDFANDHEGDWEHINVIINNQIPEKAEIESIQYYFHEKWTEIRKNNIVFADDQLQHPMVYIGGSGSGASMSISGRFGENSNASYPSGYHVYYRISVLWNYFLSTVHQNENVWSTARERVSYSSFTQSDDGPNDGKGLELLKEPVYFQSINFFDTENHPEYSWFNTNIRWGEPKSEVIKNISVHEFHEDISSKINPSRKPAWKKVGSSSEFGLWDGTFAKIRIPN